MVVMHEIDSGVFLETFIQASLRLKLPRTAIDRCLFRSAIIYTGEAQLHPGDGVR